MWEVNRASLHRPAFCFDDDSAVVLAVVAMRVSRAAGTPVLWESLAAAVWKGHDASSLPAERSNGYMYGLSVTIPLS